MFHLRRLECGFAALAVLYVALAECLFIKPTRRYADKAVSTQPNKKTLKKHFFETVTAISVFLFSWICGQEKRRRTYLVIKMKNT